MRTALLSWTRMSRERWRGESQLEVRIGQIRRHYQYHSQEKFLERVGDRDVTLQQRYKWEAGQPERASRRLFEYECD
jgi:hypothetical protein